MNIDLSEIKADIIGLCEDNEVMKNTLEQYFNELEESSYFKIATKE